MKIITYIFILLFFSTNLHARQVNIIPFQIKLKAIGLYSGEINGIVNEDYLSSLRKYLALTEVSCPAHVDKKQCKIIIKIQKGFVN